MMLRAMTLFLLMTTPLHASTLFRCEAKKDDWTASITLNSEGRAMGTFRKKGQKSHTAALSIRSFQHSPRAKVPGFRMEFVAGDWKPEFDKGTEKEILPELTLVTHLNSKRKPMDSVLQFLRYAQTTPCIYKEFNFSELSRHHKRWELGTWGK